VRVIWRAAVVGQVGLTARPSSRIARAVLDNCRVRHGPGFVGSARQQGFSMSRHNARNVFIAAMVLALGVAGCMPGPNPLKGTPIGEGHAAGFWLGLWHGVLGPVTFVMSLFKEGTGFYEVHNNGGWYNAGFLLGLAMVLGGRSFQGKVQVRKGGGREIASDAADASRGGGGPAGASAAQASSDRPAESESARDAESDASSPPRPGSRPPN
jgi:hypothetical protein